MISMKNSIHTGALTSAVFGLATMAFFGIFYPYHIHFQEQSQLFEWTWKYFIDVVRVPGGFADWCGRFLTQFCSGRMDIIPMMDELGISYSSMDYVFNEKLNTIEIGVYR